jgi:organic radical activating enzyme
MRGLLSFEWVIFDNCNFKCSYCVNKGEYSHKEAGQMLYVPGWELDIARKIVELSAFAKKVDVNLTGGEPLLSTHIREVVSILKSAPNIKIHLITNFSLIDRVMDILDDFDSVLLSLHMHHRHDKDTKRLVGSINQAKKKVPLILSQVDHNLSDEDKQALSDLESGTGLSVSYQAFIPPWTDDGKVSEAKKISDATFVSSLGKRCILGYFNYFLLPDGTFYYGLWCHKHGRKTGNFLAPLDENKDIFFPKEMGKCKASSCGCNYNTYCYNEYLAECKKLGYPKNERFGRYNKRISYVLTHQLRHVPGMVARYVKNMIRR